MTANSRLPLVPLLAVPFLGILVAITYLLTGESAFKGDAGATLDRLASNAESSQAFHVQLTLERLHPVLDAMESKEVWVDDPRARHRVEVSDKMGHLTSTRTRLRGDLFELDEGVNPAKFEQRGYVDTQIARRQAQEDDLYLFKSLLDAGILASSIPVTIGSQSAIKLVAASAGEDGGQFVAYIDTQRGWPIQLEWYEGDDLTPSRQTKFQYELVEEIDSTGLLDDFFILSPPPGADVYVLTEMSTADARNFTDFPIYFAGEAILQFKLDRIQQMVERTSVAPDVNQVSVIYKSGDSPGNPSITITILPSTSVAGGSRIGEPSLGVTTEFGQAQFYLRDSMLELRVGTMLVLIHTNGQLEALAVADALTRLNNVPDPTPLPLDGLETAPTPVLTPSPKPAPDPILVPDPTAVPSP